MAAPTVPNRTGSDAPDAGLGTGGAVLPELRRLWLAFLLQVPAVGVVVALLAAKAEHHDAAWHWVIVAGGLVLGAVGLWFARRPLDGRDVASLRQSYRSRLVVRSATANDVALIAFGAFKVTGSPWAYVLGGLVAVAVHVAWVAPSAANLARDQAALDAAGAPVRLDDALGSALVASA